MNRRKSFTLIELLVVIVIIGILAGVIMISTSSAIKKANIAKVKVFEESIQNNLAANMVSRWKLDGNVNDSWGSSHGTPAAINYSQGQDGIGNGAASFNGINSYIDFGNNIAATKTISLWIKINLIPTDHQIIFVHKPSNSGLGFYNGNSFILASSGSSDMQRISNLSNFNVGKWNHITITYNDSKIPTIFINGQEPEYIGTNFWKQTSNYFYVGKRDTGNFFNGLIDDIRIYSATLSTTQIKQNYIAGLNSMLSRGNMTNEEYISRINSLGKNN